MITMIRVMTMMMTMMAKVIMMGTNDGNNDVCS